MAGNRRAFRRGENAASILELIPGRALRHLGLVNDDEAFPGQFRAQAALIIGRQADKANAPISRGQQLASPASADVVGRT